MVGLSYNETGFGNRHYLADKIISEPVSKYEKR